MHSQHRHNRLGHESSGPSCDLHEVLVTFLETGHVAAVPVHKQMDSRLTCHFYSLTARDRRCSKMVGATGICRSLLFYHISDHFVL